MASVQDLVKQILLAAHPVGSYYWSSESTDPGTLFGGTWERVKGRFVYASDADTAGATGGASSHTISIAEMPKHHHGVHVFTGGYDDGGSYDGYLPNLTGTGFYKASSGAKLYHRWHGAAFKTWGTTDGQTGTGDPAGTTDLVGGGSAMSIMPPYITAFCWRRTA